MEIMTVPRGQSVVSIEPQHVYNPRHGYIPQQHPSLYHQVTDVSGDQELILRFLEEQKPTTKKEYKKVLMDFVNFLQNKLYIGCLHEVGIAAIQDYKYHLQTYQKKSGGNLSPATIAQRLRIVSSLFSFGVKANYFQQNPVNAIKKPQVKNFNDDKYLTMDEVKAILGALHGSSAFELNDQNGRKKKSAFRKPELINARNHLIGLTLFYLGLRVSELCSIRWCDFFTNPKGHIGLTIHQKGGGTRVVKIRPDLWEYIKEYRESTGMKITFSQKDESPLFLNPQGEALTHWYVRKLLRNACEKAGVDKPITPHWFRHTSASQALALGADIVSVQRQFGWTNLNTPNRYLHSVKGLDDTATDIMPEMGI